MAPPTMVIPRAGSVAMAANSRFAAGDYDDCMTLTPSYLRRSEAEVLWEKRARQRTMSVTIRRAVLQDLPEYHRH